MIDRPYLRALAQGSLVVALFLVAPVVGATPPGDDDATSLRIAELYKRANALYGEKNLVEAEAVTVGDRVVGKSPVDEEVFVTAGQVTVGASAPGYAPALQSVPIAKGGSADVSLTLLEPRRSLVPAVVIGGVGVAALGVGAAFIGIAQSKKSSAQALAVETNHACPLSPASQQGNCKNLESAASSADTFGNVGIGALVTAGVAAAAVATYLLWPAPHRPTTSGRSVRVLPVAGTDGGGVTVTGSF
jgi:hypothetical protein